MLDETFELLDSLNFWYIRYRVMPKRTIIIIIIIIIILVITCMQCIYTYMSDTVFLGFIALQLFLIYNLSYMQCYFTREIFFVLLR